MSFFRRGGALVALALSNAAQALAMGPADAYNGGQLQDLYTASQNFRTQWKSGPGLTQAQVRRMARKKRNQIKNRKQHR